MPNDFSILFDISPRGNLSEECIPLGDFNTLQDCIKAAKLYTKLNKHFEKLVVDDFFEIAPYFKVIQYKPNTEDPSGIRETIAMVSLDVILEDNPLDLSAYTFDQ